MRGRRSAVPGVGVAGAPGGCTGAIFPSSEEMRPLLEEECTLGAVTEETRDGWGEMAPEAERVHPISS